MKRVAKTLGFSLTTTERLGVDPDLDLARFTVDNPLRTIFDVGGNFGQTALQFAASFPTATIYTFEPVPSSFQRLQKAVEGQKRIKSFNLGLGEVAGSMSMNLTSHAGSNSLLSVQSSQESIVVPIHTIDAFASAHSLESIDLLKIDVEGYELQVLQGAEGLLREQKIRYVFAECVLAPDTESAHTSFFELHQVLEQQGFCFVNYYAENFRLEMGCALGNVLYAQRLTLPKTVPGRTKNIS